MLPSVGSLMALGGIFEGHPPPQDGGLREGGRNPSRRFRSVPGRVAQGTPEAKPPLYAAHLFMLQLTLSKGIIIQFSKQDRRTCSVHSNFDPVRL